MFKMADVRKETCRLLEMVDEGYLDPMMALRMCVSYMSEDEVADMLRINDLADEDEDEGDDE